MVKIHSVDTFPLFHRLAVPYGDANGIKKYRTCFLFRITTESGVTGWGETSGWLPAVEQEFRMRIIPLLTGRSALERTRLSELISSWNPSAGAGVSMALTEIAAKRSDLAVADFWGGGRYGAVPVYASFQSYSEDADWEKRSLRLVEAALQDGFTAAKIKIGGRPLAEDTRHVRAVLALAEGAARVALDANESYDTPEALEWRHILQDADRFLWLEEPVPFGMPEDYALLRSALPVPLAGGEKMADPAFFLPMLERRSLDYLTPDPLHMGGIDRFRETAGLARMFNARISPHTFDGPLSRLYALLAQSCVPAANKMAGAPPEPVEWDAMDNPINEIWPIGPHNGEVRIPQGAGLGVEPDMEKLKAMLWDGSSFA